MAGYNFDGALSNLSLDEILVGATVQALEQHTFGLKNATNGYTITFDGSGFEYVNGAPTNGSISGISVYDASGNWVYNVEGINPATSSLAAFWNTFAAYAYSRAGSAAAFGAILAGPDTIQGGDNHDRIGVYGAGDTVMGMNGNDTFLVYNGATDVFISGTNVSGDDTGAQTDTIELHGSASFRNVLNIDALVFTYSGTATKTVTYNANSHFGITYVQGSSVGADTIWFKGGSEAVNLDLSKVAFGNWARADQTVLVDLNTDQSAILDDRFVGSTVNERVTTGNGRDLLYGNDGDDYLDGGDGIDVIDGGSGSDTLIGGGGEGPNILRGGKGNDVYSFREKVDVIIDNGGLDSRMVRKNATQSAKEKLFEGLAVDETLSVRKTVKLTGNAKANILLGHGGKNTLNGLSGNDILEGRGGNDQLNGSTGNDKFYGGLGKDTLSGGTGKDVFYFDTALDTRGNVDKIVGFSTKDDRIALDSEIFTVLGQGKLTSSSFRVNNKAKDSNDYIIYDKKKGVLYYDADGSGSASSLTKFAQIGKKLKLTAPDFLVI
ncbi:calcium-binding protein [Microvirga roseola]|uniref:calcium-binding protein n=1 Tax=Microvirga roseola TaxID=2883126 RepID=UPI001E3FCF2D|nr:calcium-binding protein [Microvirga roseola]